MVISYFKYCAFDRFWPSSDAEEIIDDAGDSIASSSFGTINWEQDDCVAVEARWTMADGEDGAEIVEFRIAVVAWLSLALSRPSWGDFDAELLVRLILIKI